MSKSSVFLALTLMMTLGAANVFAAGPGPGPGDKAGPGSRSISWDEFRARCANPRDFDVQVPPQNIKVQCTDDRTLWVASDPGTLALPSQRVVSMGVFADKFFVNTSQDLVPMATQEGSCHRFKEVEQTFTIEQPLTCDQILGMKGSIADYCVAVLDSAKGANPKLTDQKDTGRVIDTCGDGALQAPVKPDSSK